MALRARIVDTRNHKEHLPSLDRLRRASEDEV